MSHSQSVVASGTVCLQDDSEEFGKEFWQQWQQYRDTLYRCCVKWIGVNQTDAEDVLS